MEQAYDLRDGTHCWRLSLNPLRHKYGDAATVDVLLTGLDITPKMELTRQLEISTSRFRSVVDAAYDAIITIDQEHNITLFNRAAEFLFGYSQSEMIGRPLSRLIPERFRERHSGYIHHFARSPVNSRESEGRWQEPRRMRIGLNVVGKSSFELEASRQRDCLRVGINRFLELLYSLY